MRRLLAGMMLSGICWVAACGHVTAPVAPDDFGIGLRLKAERAKDEKARQEQIKKEKEQAEAAAKPPEEGVQAPPDEVVLPDMRPVGGR